MSLLESESVPVLTAPRAVNYLATAGDLHSWDPVALAKRNPTNDPPHARMLTWNNVPPTEQQSRRKLGLVADDAAAAALRRMETLGHVPGYLPPGLPASYGRLHTALPTAGYVKLPRG